jgi:hypothetical protein
MSVFIKVGSSNPLYPIDTPAESHRYLTTFTAHHDRAQGHHECQYRLLLSLDFIHRLTHLPPLLSQIIDNSGGLIAECINVLKAKSAQGMATVGQSCQRSSNRVFLTDYHRYITSMYSPICQAMKW